IQGSSGAGKSRTLRRIIEEAFDYTTLAIVDPEGEFENLARHIGATTIRAVELTADGLTAAATRSRRHRLSMHIDLTDLDPDQRIIKAAAFFAGLVGAPREDWAHTMLVCIDEGHLLAPHVAGSARDAD
ncbi:ATP-binding protein, partial [Escherichia coli]|nr:ATP-binding protein [Escherichia coli]